ncbi:hypothetical protein AWM75_05780 [Aerococcus urinaehominis]|uniref:Uncharacterized protein n=2 Tax=Aerococcus urinaehominis TaxID=128944 RepID=A0A109RGS3_9LACT|nr:hypothetical protein AWM75_05780 [Aerococcus urinaehominis]SDM34299.1 NlpC/P60 family protein [Aerococcus urinaehominis]
MGQTIPLDQAQAGDLYFFIEAGATSSYHVAIATGEGYFIHAPQPGDVVSYSHVDYFSPQLAIRLN